MKALDVVDTAFKLYGHYAANEQGEYHQTKRLLFDQLAEFDPVRFNTTKAAALNRSNRPVGKTIELNVSDEAGTGDYFGPKPPKD